ncbi:Arc family DNA-binding protein [Pseudorhodobacter aquimaris]|uniref:Arc family DNA-binding protein n=1 Tax=Pseudorhodobacter aquimaris TaxID=687412 RepID=UPI00067AE4E7|nr:Arc family DNA-binding protein [Pseudorhodobacter aquimaris]
MTTRKPLQLRLPTDLKEWIEGEAEKNGSSQNSEIIRAIRDRMERTSHQPA